MIWLFVLVIHKWVDIYFRRYKKILSYWEYQRTFRHLTCLVYRNATYYLPMRYSRLHIVFRSYTNCFKKLTFFWKTTYIGVWLVCVFGWFTIRRIFLWFGFSFIGSCWRVRYQKYIWLVVLPRTFILIYLWGVQTYKFYLGNP